MSRRIVLCAAASLLFLIAACGGSATRTPGAANGPLIVVSAPLTAAPWIGGFTERGARLAVERLNAGRKLPYRLEVLDNAASPQTAAANARKAVADGAVALITDGTGALAVSQVTDPAALPVFVVFDGGGSFIDAKARPTLFRLAPANRYLTRRLADYLSAKATSVAVLGDDSSYGRDGVAPLITDLERNGIAVVSRAVLPVGAADVSAQVLAARRADAQALVVWADASDVAAVVRAARSTGWQVPIFTGTTGEDPLVRQRLADHPEWLDGTTFVSFRMTTEQGPGPFNAFRAAYEKRFGADQVGVSAGGRPVVQPPDWATYSYDAVVLVEAALAHVAQAGGTVLAALQVVSTTSANGDERGYSPDDREGVSPSDMYFGQFQQMRFAPVKDDLLSTHLPTISQ